MLCFYSFSVLPVLAEVFVSSTLIDKTAQSAESESSSCIYVFTSTMKHNENRADVPQLVSAAQH